MEHDCCLRAGVLLLLLSTACYLCGQQKDAELADGATLVIQLEQDVHADRAKAGDEVHAKLVAPVMIHGAVAVPAKAKITAVVLFAERLTPEHPSRLILRFLNARWHNAACALNAYVARQLVIQHSYAMDTHPFCSPVERFIPQPLGQAPPASGTEDTCSVPLGSKRETARSMIFTSPAIVGIALRKLLTPKGGMALESATADISLPKGMMLEIRHSAE